MFGSSEKMFLCLTMVAETSFDFIHFNDEDSKSIVLQKIELINKFFSLDPFGAGGPAREYWTSWGINPDA